MNLYFLCVKTFINIFMFSPHGRQFISGNSVDTDIE